MNTLLLEKATAGTESLGGGGLAEKRLPPVYGRMRNRDGRGRLLWSHEGSSP